MCHSRIGTPSDLATSSASIVLPVPGSPFTSSGRCSVIAALTASVRSSVETYDGEPLKRMERSRARNWRINRHPLARDWRTRYRRRRHSDSHAEVISRRAEKRARHGRGGRNIAGERASETRIDPGASAWNGENRSGTGREAERAEGEGPAECADLHAPGIEVERQAWIIQAWRSPARKTAERAAGRSGAGEGDHGERAGARCDDLRRSEVAEDVVRAARDARRAEAIIRDGADRPDSPVCVDGAVAGIEAAGLIDRPQRSAARRAGNVECRQSLAGSAPGPGQHLIGDEGGNAVCVAGRRGPGSGESQRGRGGEDGGLPARILLLGDDEGARLRRRHLARTALGVEAGARQGLARLVALVAARARLALEPVVEEVRRRDEVLRRSACASDIEERVGGVLVLAGLVHHLDAPVGDAAISSIGDRTAIGAAAVVVAVDHGVVGASDADRRGRRAHRVALAVVEPPDRSSDGAEAAFQEAENAARLGLARVLIGVDAEYGARPKTDDGFIGHPDLRIARWPDADGVAGLHRRSGRGADFSLSSHDHHVAYREEKPPGLRRRQAGSGEKAQKNDERAHDDSLELVAR